MTSIKTAVLLSAALMLSASAHAGQAVDTEGFSLAQPGNWNSAQMTVLSNQGGTLQIGIQGMEPNYTVATDSGDQPWYNWDAMDTVLAANVKAGYKIASITLSGTLTGLLDVAPLPAECGTANYGCGLGVATNQATLAWSIDRGDTALDLQQLEVNNLNGVKTFSLTTTAVLGQSFNFYVATYNTAAAEAGHVTYVGSDWHSTNYLPTTSEIGFGDMVMTVQIVAVPEPGTYAMLLAGMGLLGVAARRQRG